MKRIKQLVLSLAVLTLLLVGSSVKAEILQTTLNLEPNRVPANSWYNCDALVTIVVKRDSNGVVIGAAATFQAEGALYFPFTSFVTVTGLDIREGTRTGNGPVVITTNTDNPHFVTGGEFAVNVPATGIDLEALKRLLKNPSSFYVHLTTEIDSGAVTLRAQISYLTELHATTVNLSPGNEGVGGPNASATATATATITAHPARNAETGAIAGGFVNFTVTYDFAGPVTITGLNLHEAGFAEKAAALIHTGISEANPVFSQTGKGTITLNAPVTTEAEVASLNRLLVNPGAFHVDLFSSVSPNGVMRAQLGTLSLPPIIVFSIQHVAGPDTPPGTVGVLVLNFDDASRLVIDGQVVPTIYRQNTFLRGQIPVSSGTEPRINVVQVKNAQGVLSEPNHMFAFSRLSAPQAVLVDAARFRSSLARDSICTAFGTALSTNSVSATSTALPTSLDGTSVYVNGLSASLFYVSPTQVNFQIPYNHFFNRAEIIVVAKDGTLSRGLVNVNDISPAIFTRLANGRGAPSAYASIDGVNFNIDVSNADGSAAAIDAGAYVSLYGTGIRHTSGPVSVSIGGTSVAALFAGPHGTFAGLDQVNFQIPSSLAGRGEVEVLIYVDGEASNSVKLNIR